jgi:hypothetical protein
MPGSSDEYKAGVQLFGLDVKQGKEAWSVKHRYNDFRVLKDTFGPEADSFPEAPFPGKFMLPWLTDSMKADRRTGLEKWLKQAIQTAQTKDSWKLPLQEFLHSAAEIGKHWKDYHMDIAQTVNEQSYSAWDKTATQLNIWYEQGLAQCEDDAKCKASKEKFASLSLTISAKAQEVKEGMGKYMDLTSVVDSAKAQLEKMKGTSSEMAAEEALEKAQKEAVLQMQAVVDLKGDVAELSASAQATMENSLKRAVANTEL